MDRDLFELLQFLGNKTRTPLRPEGDDPISRKNFDRQVNMVIWLRDHGYIDCRDGCIQKDNGLSGFKYLLALVDGLKYPGEKVISFGTYEKYYEAEVKRSSLIAFTDQSININGSINQSAIAVNSANTTQSVAPLQSNETQLIEEIRHLLEIDKKIDPQRKKDAMIDLKTLARTT